MSWSDKVRQVKAQNPKVTPTPTKARQAPIAHINLKPNPVPKSFQSFNLSGIFTSKPTPMTQSSVPKDLDKIPASIKDEISRDISDTKRVTNTAVKDVNLPLNVKLDDFIDTSMPKDDDVDPIEDASQLQVLPYPGHYNFGRWLESQFPTIIPPGAAAFLRQL